MQAVILDPSLRGHTGHMLVQATGLAQALRAAGYGIRILGHQSLPALEALAELSTERHFSVSQYDRPDTDPSHGRRRSHGALVPVLAAEIAQAVASAPDAHLVLPTVNATLLAALAEALAMPGLDHRNLSLHLLLSLECGMALDDEGHSVVNDIWLAGAMRAAFRTLRRLKPAKLHLLGVSAEMATLYDALAEGGVTPVPSAHPRRIAAGAVAQGREQVLLYAGQAAMGRDFGRLAALAPLAAEAMPGVAFIVQLHQAEGPEHAETTAVLREAATRLPNLTLLDGHLPEERLTQLIAESGVVVLAYGREHYRGKTSGFLWEAVGAGRAVVVPAGTWMAREAVAVGGSAVAYGPETPPAILAAIGDALALARAGVAVPEQAREWGPEALVRRHFARISPQHPGAAGRRAPRRLTPARQLDLASALAGHAFV